MSERNTQLRYLMLVFGASFFFGCAAFWGSWRRMEQVFYERMAAVASSCDGDEEALMEAIKEPDPESIAAGAERLRRYGYEGLLSGGELYPVFAGGGILFAGAVTASFFVFLWRIGSRQRRRIGELTEYLRGVERGDGLLFPERRQDLFSNLEDEIYKTVLALRESRERLALEKKRLADNLADISHQFKTPLTAITLTAELLGRHNAGTEDARLAGRIVGQTERLADLTAALLALSRADAGVLDLSIREVPLRELIECSVEAMTPLLEKKEQKLHISEETGEGGPILLRCDLGWTKEALSNLIRNASEHAPEKTGLYIRAWDNPLFTAIVVEDEGAGFSAKDLPHLFERFYRGEGNKAEGAGIGLSLAKALIEAQNGQIRAENRKEGGARFVIKFYKDSFE